MKDDMKDDHVMQKLICAMKDDMKDDHVMQKLNLTF